MNEMDQMENLSVKKARIKPIGNWEREETFDGIIHLKKEREVSDSSTQHFPIHWKIQRGKIYGFRNPKIQLANLLLLLRFVSLSQVSICSLIIFFLVCLFVCLFFK